MNRIIRLEDTPDDEHSIQSMKYAPFEWDRLSIPYDQITQEQAEQNAELLTLCSMIYALRFLEAAEVREKGFQAGHEEGQALAIKEMQSIADSQLALQETLRKGLEELASLKNTILSQAEGGIVQLAVAIAKKLVCRELQQHPDTIIAVVKEAIKVARIGEEITIKIHPNDYATLEQYMGELRESLERIGKDNVSIRIEEAPELTPGGCVVETDTNLIDMSLETRMESVFSALDT